MRHNNEAIVALLVRHVELLQEFISGAADAHAREKLAAKPSTAARSNRLLYQCDVEVRVFAELVCTGEAGRASANDDHVGLSVLIDVDHFPIARVAVGDWRHLRRVLADPALLLFGQDEIFDLDFRRTRIASHLLVGAGLTATLRRRAPAAAVVTAVCLAAHVVADALRDGDVV